MIDQFWTFCLAITLLTLFPGVDSLLVVRNASRGGWRDGIATSTGICCGLFGHALISALGISALLIQSAAAFQLLKLAGGAYLIWLGGSSLAEAWRGSQPESGIPGRGPSPPLLIRRSLREGLLSNLFNPKTLLFYLAFLPQFINPAHSALIQSLLMAAIHFVIAMVYQSLLTLFVVRLKGLWIASRWRRWASGGIGALLVLFGIRVLLEKRL